MKISATFESNGEAVLRLEAMDEGEQRVLELLAGKKNVDLRTSRRSDLDHVYRSSDPVVSAEIRIKREPAEEAPQP